MGFIVKKIKNWIYYYSHKETKTSKGQDFQNKIFYVIGIDYATEGLLAIVKNVLVHIEYAIEKGYVPVVDMENFRSQFGSDKTNVWELFFEQPGGFKLQDIKKAHNIILSRNITSWRNHSIYVTLLDSIEKERHMKMSGIYKKYIIPSTLLKNRINSAYDEIIGNKENVLGVLCRGTDYTQRKPKNHPVQPTFEQIKLKVDEFVRKYSIKYIYLATEDVEYLNMFKLQYGSMVLYIDQQRFGKLNVDYICNLNIEHNDLVTLNIDYYTSLTILSRCDYFIAGRTAGSLGVSLMTLGFKDKYYFNLGYYK